MPDTAAQIDAVLAVLANHRPAPRHACTCGMFFPSRQSFDRHRYLVADAARKAAA